MNVIYDISTVGSRPEARTGVARVAWTTATLLRERLGDQLSLAATGSISAALQAEMLLRQHPEFTLAGRPVSPVARQVHSLQEKIAQQQRDRPLQPAQNVAQAMLTNVSRLLNITRMPIDRHILRQADLFHSPYARIPAQVRRALSGRHILTVNDLIPLVLDPGLFPAGQIAITKRMIDSVQPGDWVITISDATRNDLCNYRPVTPERVITVHLAASNALFYPVADAERIHSVRQKYGIPPGDYLLTLNSLAPHKNLAHLIRSFQQLIEQERITDLNLVACGGQGKPVGEILKGLGLEEADLRQVHFTGFAADEDLAALYSGALAFVFPSLYEGFGLPVLEAMQCGCPVICSNTSSLPEIVGEAGLLVVPDDKHALSAVMSKLYRDQSLANQLAMLGQQRSGAFSWEKTIAETLEVYRQVAGGKGAIE